MKLASEIATITAAASSKFLNYCNAVIASLGVSMGWLLDLSTNTSIWIEICVGLVLISWAFFNAALGIAKIIRAKKGKNEKPDGPTLTSKNRNVK
jgi:F0F1-type ATP synthase assembly protein I